MIRKQKNTHLLLKNKYFRMLLFVLLLAILVVGIIRYWDRYRLVHSPIYVKLQGDYQIVLDSSYIDRPFDVIPQDVIVVTMQIQHDRISLPNLNSYTNANMSLFGYSWKVVSSNPDSILIDAYPHTLHGKYNVTFKTYKSGTLGYTTTDYVYFDNDSTHLCFMKIK